MSDPVTVYNQALLGTMAAARDLFADPAFEALLPHFEALRVAAPTSAEVEAAATRWSSSWWQPVDAGDPLVP